MRQRTQTFSHSELPETDKASEEKNDLIIPISSRIRHHTISEESNRRRERNFSGHRGKGRLGLKLNMTSPAIPPNFKELEPRLGSLTAPINYNNNNIEPSRRTFSFGAGAMPEKLQRKITRQMTISGDSTYSTPGSIMSGNLNRMVTRAISRQFTLGSITDGSNSTIQIEEWKPIFDILDLEADGRSDGKIPVEKFYEILESDPMWKASVPQYLRERIIKMVDRNNDGVIDFDEFLTLVKGQNLGLGKMRRQAFRQLLKETVEFIVPYKYTYQNEYSCWPPPFFMLTLSLLQLVIFTYNSLQEIGDIGLYDPVPYCSHLIYNPNRRNQIWRYVTYSLIHSGLFHVSFNILIQLILGVPLEMVNGWYRVGAVYISGVVAGSLWTSIMKPGVFLSGGSGGVYALIMSHLATVIMNHREMSHPKWRVAIVLLVALTDIVVYVYETVVLGQPSKPISYPAHVAGAIAGLFVGLVCLRHLSWGKRQRYLWWISITFFSIMMLIGLIWNLADQSHFTKLAMSFNCTNNKFMI